MKLELEELKKISEEKSKKVRERKENLEELPKIIRELEAQIRKGYSLFFDENVFSKKELQIMESAPTKLKTAMYKFYHQSLGKSVQESSISISIGGTFQLKKNSMRFTSLGNQGFSIVTL